MNFRWLHTMKTTGLEVNFSADFGGIYQNIVESMHWSIAEISSRKGMHELNFCDWSIDWFGFKAAYFRQLFSHLNAVFYWLSQFLTIEYKNLPFHLKYKIKLTHACLGHRLLHERISFQLQHPCSYLFIYQNGIEN